MHSTHSGFASSSDEFQVLESPPKHWPNTPKPTPTTTQLSTLLHNLLSQLKSQQLPEPKKTSLKQTLKTIAHHFDFMLDQSLTTQKQMRTTLIGLHRKNEAMARKLQEAEKENSGLRERVQALEGEVKELEAEKRKIEGDLIASRVGQYQAASGEKEKASKFVEERMIVERQMQKQLSEVIRLLEQRKYLFRQEYMSHQQPPLPAAKQCHNIQQYVGQISRSLGVYQASVQAVITQHIRQKMGMQIKKKHKQQHNKQEQMLEQQTKMSKKQQQIKAAMNKKKSEQSEARKQAKRNRKSLMQQERNSVMVKKERMKEEVEELRLWVDQMTQTERGEEEIEVVREVVREEKRNEQRKVMITTVGINTDEKRITERVIQMVQEKARPRMLLCDFGVNTDEKSHVEDTKLVDSETMIKSPIIAKEIGINTDQIKEVVPTIIKQSETPITNIAKKLANNRIFGEIYHMTILNSEPKIMVNSVGINTIQILRATEIKTQIQDKKTIQVTPIERPILSTIGINTDEKRVLQVIVKNGEEKATAKSSLIEIVPAILPPKPKTKSMGINTEKYIQKLPQSSILTSQTEQSQKYHQQYIQQLKSMYQKQLTSKNKQIDSFSHKFQKQLQKIDLINSQYQQLKKKLPQGSPQAIPAVIPEGLAQLLSKAKHENKIYREDIKALKAENQKLLKEKETLQTEVKFIKNQSEYGVMELAKLKADAKKSNEMQSGIKQKLKQLCQVLQSVAFDKVPEKINLMIAQLQNEKGMKQISDFYKDLVAAITKFLNQHRISQLSKLTHSPSHQQPLTNPPPPTTPQQQLIEQLQTTIALLEIQKRRKINDLQKSLKSLQCQSSQHLSVLRTLNLLLQQFKLLKNCPDSTLKPLFLKSKFRDHKYNTDPKYKPFCTIVEENVHLRQCLAQITSSEVLWEHMDVQAQEVGFPRVMVDYGQPIDEEFKIQRLSSLTTVAPETRRSTEKCVIF